MIRTDRFKNGKQHIVTMSYDDGPESDIKLIEIFKIVLDRQRLVHIV